MGPPDVIVVGGGLVGAACARQLAGQHLRVEILDSGAEPGIASAAAGGMLGPLAESTPENPTLSLLVRGRDLYRELAPLLKEETGIDIGLWSEGIVQLAMTTGEAAELTHEIAWQRQRGFKSDWLPQEDLLSRYPGLSHDVVGGKLAPEDGRVEPESLLKAFHASAKRRGAKLQRGVRVQDVIVEGNTVTGVRTEKGPMPSGAVVIAAGAWSGRIGGLPRPLSVEPIRGQMVAVDWPPGEPPAIMYAGTGYVLHRNGDALGGTTMEHAGFEASTTEGGIAHVREVMRSVYPALENLEVKRAWAGLRPCSPDGHPIVGPDADVEALWYATGHGRNGVLLAAITGEIIAQLFTDEPIEFDIKPMDPGRYWKTQRP